MNKKYQIIYADPPWNFENYGKTEASKTCGRNVKRHYPTMPIEDICKLTIPTDSNAVLLMWAVFPKLKEALRVMQDWGFEFKTVAFTWVKTNKKSNSLFWGMGYYTRSNAEICLLGIKGKPLKRLSHSIHSVIMSPISKHSEKPSQVRKKIVELFGDLPRIELFSRQKTEGWDVWGNEVESDIKL